MPAAPARRLLSTPGTRGSSLWNRAAAAAVADELQRLMRQMRANPIQVITPGGVPLPTCRSRTPEKKPQSPPDMPKAPDARRRTAGDIMPVAHAARRRPSSIRRRRRNAKPEDKPGKADMPVVIAASGNRIIITSQDPDALAMASQLVRLMTQTTAGEGDFEVIHLKTASAAEAAKLLDAAFNEPKPAAQQQGFGGFFGRFGGRGAEPPANPTPNRIRVVADPTTNSLLVRAKPVDMLTIRWLLAKAIDNNDTDATAGPKNRIIGPLKYAKATTWPTCWPTSTTIRSTRTRRSRTSARAALVSSSPGRRTTTPTPAAIPAR